MAQEGRKGTKGCLEKASELYLCVYTCDKHEAGFSENRLSPEESILRILMLYRNFDKSGKPHEIFNLFCVLNGGDSVPAVINGVKDCISVTELNCCTDSKEAPVLLWRFSSFCTECEDHI